LFSTTVVISSSATSTIIYLITTVSSVTCDEMLASIDSIDFIKKSYCADYGTVRKFYDDVKTDIDVIERFFTKII
jgi:hypothetical protein